MATSFRHVLFLSRPDTDHLYLTLAVAEELGRRGHTVTFATSDPFADEDAEGGVVLLRYGSDPRTLRDRPVFRAQGPVDLVVCDPDSQDAARGWGAPVVLAHTNLAWPDQRTPGQDDYVYVNPTGRGTVFGEWSPADSRPVLAVAHDAFPLAALADFAHDWQVVLCDRDTDTDTDRDTDTDSDTAGLPPHVTAAGPGLAPVAAADVLLTDGRLAGITAGLRHATPMVLVPGTPAQRRDAARVVALGVGVLLDRTGLTPQSVRRTVSHLAVDEPTHAEARAVRALVTDAGSPARVSDLLESAAVDVGARAA
ncbi:glycosyltransferase [Actinophytocola xinjiangensis]|nr:hypothetical protein [Actinophytocola xinjiangensis]